MSRQAESRELMEQIWHVHKAFERTWSAARAAALNRIAPEEAARSWAQVWQANGIAYQSAEPLSRRRNRLLAELLQDRLAPLYRELNGGSPDAIDAAIDFL